MFPLGELTKPEVREMARQLGLSTAEKPESMEICFVPDGDYARFLGKQLGADHAALSAGALVTSSGEVIGEHDGYARYTVGQRSGLGGGRSLPLYVIGTRPADARGGRGHGGRADARRRVHRRAELAGRAARARRRRPRADAPPRPRRPRARGGGGGRRRSAWCWIRRSAP